MREKLALTSQDVDLIAGDNVTKTRIRFKLKSGQWTYWLTPEEVARYRNDFIEAAVIEETMSYEEAMKVMKVNNLSAEPKFKEYYKGET